MLFLLLGCFFVIVLVYGFIESIYNSHKSKTPPPPNPKIIMLSMNGFKTKQDFEHIFISDDSVAFNQYGKMVSLPVSSIASLNSRDNFQNHTVYLDLITYDKKTYCVDFSPRYPDSTSPWIYSRAQEKRDKAKFAIRDMIAKSKSRQCNKQTKNETKPSQVRNTSWYKP